MTDIPYELLMKIQQGTMAYQYRGLPLLKNPFDLAIYPLLLARLQPRTLIEIGTHAGGSALWFADQAPGMRVYSIDLQAPAGVAHPSVTFLEGDARDLGAILPPSLMESIARPLLVVEDSSHFAGTTAAVLDFFDRWLRPGEYLVIEDGILTAMRVADSYDGGPLRAIHEFMARTNGRYEIDRALCDYFGTNVTWNVDGYLRRVS
ncbi:MAG TPA: CmcI family methyltransferase [Thermoanaerobaculia bacterium]|jgi:cephalosporin hydroxylase|nr:CmcI family methyltransferase [Thermoanaerobaculia bacterium]